MFAQHMSGQQHKKNQNQPSEQMFENTSRTETNCSRNASKGAFPYPSSCDWCPRACGANRLAGERGVCGASNEMRVARAALHFWEEPPISGEAGSGTVFFTHCPLKCVYCQNYEIALGDMRALEETIALGDASKLRGTNALGRADELGGVSALNEIGKSLTPEQLANTFLNLQDQGALNINLVTPTHHWPVIKRAVNVAQKSTPTQPTPRKNTTTQTPAHTSQKSSQAQTPREETLHLPIVWNTSGYETPEAIRALRSTVDVYLTDFKYADPQLAKDLSNAPDYPRVALDALREMLRATDTPKYDEYAGQVRLVRGVVVRHMLLPGQVNNSLRVLDALADIWREWDAKNNHPKSHREHECVNNCGLEDRGINQTSNKHTQSEQPEPSRVKQTNVRAIPKTPPPFLLSIMNQYTPVIARRSPAPRPQTHTPHVHPLALTPQSRALQKYPELARPATSAEYEEVLDYADSLGFEDYFWQEGQPAKESFIPAFDLTGV